jgi:hypothetical protein
LIFGFPAVGEEGRFCRWDDMNEGVDEALLVIGDSSFPNSADPTIFVNFAWAVDEFYSPSIICTSVEADLVEIYFDFVLVKDKLE